METGIEIEFHLSYSENSVCNFFHIQCSFDISSGAKITIEVNFKKNIELLKYSPLFTT